MARAGASKSLDKPAPRARGAAEAAKPAPGPRPAPRAAAARQRPKAEGRGQEGGGQSQAKAAKGGEDQPPADNESGKTCRRAQEPAVEGAGGEGSQGDDEDAPAKAAKAAKAAPARAATKAKSPTVARSTRPKKTPEGTPGGGTPKGKRGGAATKAPPKAAGPVATDRTADLPAKTLEKLRSLLEEERETYVRQAHDLAAEAEALASEREPGDTQFDEESGEGDTLNVERERDLALSASARQAVEEIDRALARMDAGELRHLRALRQEDRRRPASRRCPCAALCIECKSREERRR